MHSSTSLDAIGDIAVLAEPVCDELGQMLLPAGTKLTEAMVTGLRRRGVKAVVLAPSREPTLESEVDLQAQQARVDARMTHLFRYALRTGQINPLLHMVSRYRMGNMS